MERYAHIFEPALHLEHFQSSKASLNGTTESLAAAPFIKNSPQELVIFCGSPGAGKSTFFWDVLQPLGYERVNQDILKTVRTLSPRAFYYYDRSKSLDVILELIPCIYHFLREFQAETFNLP